MKLLIADVLGHCPRSSLEQNFPFPLKISYLTRTQTWFGYRLILGLRSGLESDPTWAWLRLRLGLNSDWSLGKSGLDCDWSVGNLTQLRLERLRNSRKGLGTFKKKSVPFLFLKIKTRSSTPPLLGAQRHRVLGRRCTLRCHRLSSPHHAHAPCALHRPCTPQRLCAPCYSCSPHPILSTCFFYCWSWTIWRLICLRSLPSLPVVMAMGPLSTGRTEQTRSWAHWICSYPSPACLTPFLVFSCVCRSQLFTSILTSKWPHNPSPLPRPHDQTHAKRRLRTKFEPSGSNGAATYLEYTKERTNRHSILIYK